MVVSVAPLVVKGVFINLNFSLAASVQTLSKNGFLFKSVVINFGDLA